MRQRLLGSRELNPMQLRILLTTNRFLFRDKHTSCKQVQLPVGRRPHLDVLFVECQPCLPPYALGDCPRIATMALFIRENGQTTS